MVGQSFHRNGLSPFFWIAPTFFVTGRMGLARKLEDYAKEKGLVSTGQKLSIFLVSDRQQLKKAATELYPGLIMTTGVVPMHSAYDHDESEIQHRGMLGTIADWWIFSRCRFFVLDSYSGFGRTAAAYGLRFNATLDIGRPDDVGLKSMDVYLKSGAGLRALEQPAMKNNRWFGH